MTPVPSLMGVATPSRRVMGTALRPPLQLSHSVLEFRLPPGYFELGIESGAGRAQVSQSNFIFVFLKFIRCTGNSDTFDVID